MVCCKLAVLCCFVTVWCVCACACAQSHCYVMWCHIVIISGVTCTAGCVSVGMMSISALPRLGHQENMVSWSVSQAGREAVGH